MSERFHNTVDPKPSGAGAAELPRDPMAQAAGLSGLTDEDVASRIAAGQVNEVRPHTSRPLWVIVKTNVFTWFNLVLGVLFALMVAFGSWRDALFGGVLVLNTLIGIGQELRAKRTLDRLSLLSAPRARVVREGHLRDVAVGDVVLDDLVRVDLGEQIVADGTVVRSQGLELDEALLTGESAPVVKKPGEAVLSGSFVVAGAGLVRVTAVGEDAYAQRIAAEGRRYTRMRSDVMDGINSILKAVALIMLPIGAVTIWGVVRGAEDLTSGVTHLVAALVAMVPEGLVLLSSVAFAISTVILARHNVLANELPAVEGLARTDVVCADKTGTLTEPTPVFGRFEPLREGAASTEEALGALGALVADSAGANPTARAIADAVPAPSGWQVEERVPFSSARKWSAARISRHGAWVLGAPDVLVEFSSRELAAGEPGMRSDEASSLAARIGALVAEGPRVLLLATAADLPEGDRLPGDLTPVGLVLLVERVRPEAPDAVRYLVDQGVTVKIISGDDPRTLAAIARRAGVPGADSALDSRGLTDRGLAEAMESHAVFGRVAPEQKARMVAALQHRGHTVAMTGDGVNDVLAVKQADLGIAMGSGSAATRAVSQIVLLDGRFSTLPLVMAEGRRVIANAERVAHLFVTKTVWAAVLALVVGLLAVPYPFLPRQITLVGTLTIGVPAFFLALGPNDRRYRPGLVRRVARFALPAGGVIALCVLLTVGVGDRLALPAAEIQTMCTAVLAAAGLAVIAVLERPLRGWRLGLVVAMAVLLVLAFVLPPARQFFALTRLDTAAMLTTAVLGSVACLGVAAVQRVFCMRG